ncbi:unnamed protein product, partial [Discosporangium mesarthrocarpum]
AGDSGEKSGQGDQGPGQAGLAEHEGHQGYAVTCAASCTMLVLLLPLWPVLCTKHHVDLCWHTRSAPCFYSLCVPLPWLTRPLRKSWWLLGT